MQQPHSPQSSHSSQSSSSKSTTRNIILPEMDGAVMEKWLTQYWPAALGVVIFLSVLFAGYTGYVYYKQDRMEKDRNEVVLWKKKLLTSIKDKNLTAEMFQKEWKVIEESVWDRTILVPTAMMMLPLIKEKKWEKEALAVFDPLLKELVPTSSLYYFFLRDLLPLYESQSQWSEAISLVESLVKDESLWLEVKWQFDLGRLYRLNKEEQKARAKFQYIIDQYPDHPLAKLARMYLES
jgi:hypothetical protein